MAIARFKDLCIDTTGSQRLGQFWASALGLRLDADGEEDAGNLVGDKPEQRIWMNVVPEPKTVKHRVHIDVHAGSLDELVELGATVLEPAEEHDRPWTVLADPEGGELCAFVRAPDQLPDYRFYELVIDAVAPKTIAAWWGDVLGTTIDGREDKGWWWLEQVPGLPFNGWSFVLVPEPKTVKNRIHWDVTVESVDPLLAAGAVMLRAKDDEISWNVMADPEDNEFCAFVSSATDG